MRANLYSLISWSPARLRSRLTAVAAAMLLAPAAWAQIEVPAGNVDSGTNGRKPFGTWWGYERSAMIYTAAEIGTTGNLTQIGFYLNGVNAPGAAATKIYLKKVSNATFAAATTVAAEEMGATLVYDATIPAASFTANKWVSVPLTAPFAYDGTANLEVIVETNTAPAGNETSAGKVFRYSSTGTNNRTQFWQTDSAPPTTVGTLSLLRPNIQLTGLAPLACAPVVTLNVTNITTTSAQLSFTPSISSTSYTVTYTPTGGTATTITPAPTASPINLTGLTLNTTYTVTITSNCAGSTTSPVVTTTFTTLAVANDNPLGAIALPISTTCVPTNGTNVGATTTPPNGYTNPGAAPNNCGAALTPRDVWYTFTTAASGAGSTAVSLQVTGSPAGYIRVFSSANGAAGPFTERACASGGANNTVSIPLNLTGLTVNTTYYVAVSGYGSADATGPFTICASSTPVAICAPPLAVSVGSITATSANLVFTPGAGNTSYTVTYYPTATPAMTTTVTPTPTASPVPLTGLTASTAYTVTLQPLCAGGGTTGLVTRTFTTTPPPPANDNCAGATALNTTATCTPITTTNAGATASTGVPAPSSTAGTGCFVAATPVNNDVWYSMVVPASGGLTVTTSAIAGSPVEDMGLVLYTGTCGALTEVGCSDDISSTNFFSSARVVGLTPGSTVYARVWSFGTTPTGQFGICAVPTIANDAAVQIIYTVSKAPISAPQVIQAVVQNLGSAPLTNVPVLLAVTGSSPFANGKIVPTLAPGASTTVTFDTYTPTATGNNTITVTVPDDGLNANNSQTATTAVTTNSLSYYIEGQATTTSVSVSSTNPGGTLAAKHIINTPSTIGEVRLTFLASTAVATYQVVILNATATGQPGTVLFTSPTLTKPTTAGVVTVPIMNTPVNGTFFVGLKEVSGGVGIAYQVEDPLRPNTYFYQTSATGAWADVNTTTLRTRLGIEVGFSTRVLSARSAAFAQDISLYPNPAHDAFMLKLPPMAGQRTAKLTLINTLGQQVQTRTVQLGANGTETQIKVDGLATGLYTLQIQTADQLATKQVVVE
ncbi:fibronectin type III domain-containing protein [Hymenobacter sp. YC55]|uniref:fibronectin type III domain-containing protein n=1 Tax=Hymenobacter sp. YC55 TaxID=3034019 RepID=UPI0023F6DD0C|nr:fibronectin type III domain-containing protein [Hymenobacter sp. YC55]MDF7814253.1 fibronectin type III domain-containing protein [Hymenobacter sp. YC55]